jgi:hypothetical protein
VIFSQAFDGADLYGASSLQTILPLRDLILAGHERTTGYNARNDEIRDNVTRMRREWATRGTGDRQPNWVLIQSRIEQHKSERRGGRNIVRRVKKERKSGCLPRWRP